MYTRALQGGHLEFGETFEACAARELKEECGITALTHVRHATTLNVVQQSTSYHYVVPVVVVQTEQEPEALEKDKCEAWEWHPWTELPQPLFVSLQALKALPSFSPFEAAS